MWVRHRCQLQHFDSDCICSAGFTVPVSPMALSCATGKHVPNKIHTINGTIKTVYISTEKTLTSTCTKRETHSQSENNTNINLGQVHIEAHIFHHTIPSDCVAWWFPWPATRTPPRHSCSISQRSRRTCDLAPWPTSRPLRSGRGIAQWGGIMQGDGKIHLCKTWDEKKRCEKHALVITVHAARHNHTTTK